MPTHLHDFASNTYAAKAASVAADRILVGDSAAAFAPVEMTVADLAGIPSSNVVVTPGGGLAAVNVQAALDELQSDVNALTAITGQYVGSAATFATLPTVGVNNGDWAILNADDGGNQAGIYIRAAGAWTLGLEVNEPSVHLAVANQTLTGNRVINANGNSLQIQCPTNTVTIGDPLSANNGATFVFDEDNREATFNEIADVIVTNGNVRAEAFFATGQSAVAGQITFREATSNGTDSLILRAAAAMPASYTITLPAAAPTVAGQVMTFGTDGTASFTTLAAAGNLYTTNGALTGNRVLDLAGNSLTFDGATGDVLFADGDVECTNAGRGLVLTDGTNRWRFSVNSSGALVTTQI